MISYCVVSVATRRKEPLGSPSLILKITTKFWCKSNVGDAGFKSGEVLSKNFFAGVARRKTVKVDPFLGKH